MNEKITYQTVVVGLGSVSVEVVGKLAFEMYGARFGVHKQTVRDIYGPVENYVVSDIASGYCVASGHFEREAIAKAQHRLEQIGEKAFLQSAMEAQEV